VEQDTKKGVPAPSARLTIVFSSHSRLRQQSSYQPVKCGTAYFYLKICGKLTYHSEYNRRIFFIWR